MVATVRSDRESNHVEGMACSAVNTARQARVIAIHRHGRNTLQLPAPANHLLSHDHRLIVVTTRTRLARILTRSIVTTSTQAC